jgi:hypothetical protein
MIAWSASGTTGREAIQLAEILLARGARAQLEEARDLLEGRANDPPLLVVDRYRMCVAGARVALALDDAAAAAEWATAALRLSVATDSGLENHPELGLVQADGRTHAWLATVAGARRSDGWSP